MFEKSMRPRKNLKKNKTMERDYCNIHATYYRGPECPDCERIRPCENCAGSGKVVVGIPAHQEAGQIVDEEISERDCEVCGGSGEVEIEEE